MDEQQQRLQEVAAFGNALEKYLAAYLNQYKEERLALSGALVRANNLAFMLRTRQAQLVEERRREGNLPKKPVVIRPLGAVTRE